MERLKTIGIIFLIFHTIQCTEPITLEEIDFDSILVVEGLITDQEQPQVIKVTRTAPITSIDSLIPESNAEVYMVDGGGERIDFSEVTPGIYQTQNNYVGVIGETYQLFITTQDDLRYQSTQVEMLATPDIDSIYMEFEFNPTQINERGGDFNVYVDARNNPDRIEHFRWTWRSAFELRMSNPSRWEWLGGNEVRIREGEDASNQVEFCWQNDSATNILVTTPLIPERGVERFQINGFHSDTRAMRIEYGIQVKQYAISKEAHDFWQLVAETNQESGFLFDRQAGSIIGNISNVDDPDEVVLGIFEAAQEITATRQYTHIDFIDTEYRRRSLYWNDCFEIEPFFYGVDSIGWFMEQFHPAWELTAFQTEPPGAYYFPARCSNCTRFGENQPPDFWED